MKNIEGQIKIDLYSTPREGNSVEIVSNRPVFASQIMVGKPPEQVLNLLPLMFNVCGTAQARTSISAIMQQLGSNTTSSQEKARDMLVLMETVREHLMRILIDWPQLFDLPRQNELFPYLSSAIRETSEALFPETKAFTLDSELNPDTQTLERIILQLEQHLARHIFQLPVEEWLDMKNTTDLTQWIEHSNGIAARSIAIIMHNNWGPQGQAPSQPLPTLDSEQLLQQFDSEDANSFIRQPQWQGKCFETTTLTRQNSHALITHLLDSFGNGLLTRWVARLLELAEIPARLRGLLEETVLDNHSASCALPTHGIAQQEAARGRLIHRVALSQGLVSQYQILAPTEWNFHPRGLIHATLSNIQGADKNETTHLARLLINAIDPCVGYDLRLH